MAKIGSLNDLLEASTAELNMTDEEAAKRLEAVKAAAMTAVKIPDLALLNIVGPSEIFSDAIRKSAKILADLSATNIAKSLEGLDIAASFHLPDVSIIRDLEKINFGLPDMSLYQAQFDRLQEIIEATQSHHAEQMAHFKAVTEAASLSLRSPFEHVFFENRLSSIVGDLVGVHSLNIAEGMRQHYERHLVVSAALPKRGWYLGGHEPIMLSYSLADSIANNDMDQVDKEIMEHLPDFTEQNLRDCLADEVPEYCLNRLCLFLRYHQSGNYEEATYIGVPVIDELARYLFNGKDFTTKGRGPMKPQIAMRSAGTPTVKEYYYSDYVSGFGSLQEDTKGHLLADENYWNRHAILHGRMKRPMGIKDSAKCLMVINFLIHSREDSLTPAEEVEKIVAELTN